jgi:O-acetyl-ADP-ribose deacetylase (regulator of RNase III)
MAYKELKGNIFNSKAQTLVNTVNCIGAMGKGIALEFKLRFPEMFKEYQIICNKKLLRPGQIWPYRKSKPWILNFAIKDDWHQPSKVEWVEETLYKFSTSYKTLGITSIAFPWMGAMNGGIPFETIQQLTRKHLSNIEDIEIEVYEFDKNSIDPLFENLIKIFNQNKVDFKENL